MAFIGTKAPQTIHIHTHICTHTHTLKQSEEEPIVIRKSMNQTHLHLYCINYSIDIKYSSMLACLLFRSHQWYWFLSFSPICFVREIERDRKLKQMHVIDSVYVCIIFFFFFVFASSFSVLIQQNTDRIYCYKWILI